jgi:hypothetical protein
MANWNEPTNSTPATNVLATLNEKVANAAKMSYGADTNLPTGAIRYNTTTRLFESWSGSAWAGLPVYFVGTGTADGSDNQTLTLAGGGAAATGRGGFTVWNGNEAAEVGSIRSYTGNAANATFQVNLAGSNGAFYVKNAADSTLFYVLQANGNVGVSAGDLVVAAPGKGLQVKEGSNAKMGVSTLAAGTVTVNTTAVTATSRIFLSHQTAGGTVGHVAVTARTAGTSFTVTSSSGSDTSQVAWLIVEPAP